MIPNKPYIKMYFTAHHFDISTPHIAKDYLKRLYGNIGNILESAIDIVVKRTTPLSLHTPLATPDNSNILNDCYRDCHAEMDALLAADAPLRVDPNSITDELYAAMIQGLFNMCRDVIDQVTPIIHHWYYETKGQPYTVYINNLQYVDMNRPIGEMAFDVSVMAVDESAIYG